MTATNQQRLGKTLWAIAEQLRGAINAPDQFPSITKMIPFSVNRDALRLSASTEESSAFAHDRGPCFLTLHSKFSLLPLCPI
jgi:siroheme synthase (precorrin-2 oxidase/ferrochelatase)